MKKKILILAAIAVSGIAAVVASNTNAFVGDADASPCELVYKDNTLMECKGVGHCSGSVTTWGGDKYSLVCWSKMVND